MNENMMKVMMEEFSEDYETGIHELADLLTFLPEEMRLAMAKTFVTVSLTY